MATHAGSHRGPAHQLAMQSSSTVGSLIGLFCSDWLVTVLATSGTREQADVIGFRSSCSALIEVRKIGSATNNS